MENAEVHTIYQNFLSELTQAAGGKKTSLPFIKNVIPKVALVNTKQIFQVMVIGGTVFRTGIVQKKQDRLVILHIESETLPLFPTKDVLMSFIAERVKQDSPYLAINFAYPLEPVFENGKLDGILLETSKGNAFKGLIGEKVGQNIETYLLHKKQQKILVSVANDTVCLTLSALLEKNSWDGAAGGIVGTGVNFAIFLDKQTVVNLEAGSFHVASLSPGAKIADAASDNRTRHLFEKEISGKYLFQHFNYLIDQRLVPCGKLKNTLQLSILAELHIPGISSYAQAILDHSAKRVAAVVAAILSFSKKDIIFAMQGSLFWKGHMYKETVQQYVKTLEPNYTASFIHVNNADILGGAKLIS